MNAASSSSPARDLPWLPQQHEARLLLTTTLPPAHLSTSALVLAFHGDQLPPSDRCARGHRRAGGHIEADETSAAALRRECLEEVGATLGPITLFATQELLVLVSLPAAYRHPYPRSYQRFYHAEVLALAPFTAIAESRGPLLLDPDAARALPAWPPLPRPPRSRTPRPRRIPSPHRPMCRTIDTAAPPALHFPAWMSMPVATQFGGAAPKRVRASGC